MWSIGPRVIKTLSQWRWLESEQQQSPTKRRSLAVISPCLFPLFTPSICLCLLCSLSFFVSTYFGLCTHSSVLSTHHFFWLLFSPSSSCRTFSLPHSLFLIWFRKKRVFFFCSQCSIQSLSQNVSVCKYMCVDEWGRCILALSESICFSLPVEIDYVFHSFFSHCFFFFFFSPLSRSFTHTHVLSSPLKVSWKIAFSPLCPSWHPVLYYM